MSERIIEKKEEELEQLKVNIGKKEELQVAVKGLKISKSETEDEINELEKNKKEIEKKLDNHKIKSKGDLEKKLMQIKKILEKNKTQLAKINEEIEHAEVQLLQIAAMIVNDIKLAYGIAKALNSTVKNRDINNIDFKNTSNIDFTSLNRKALKIISSEEINELWSITRDENRSDPEDKTLQSNFINMSAVKFNGVSSSALEDWKNNATKNGLDITIAENFIKDSLARASELVKAGILKTTDNETFKFADNRAIEILFNNYDKSTKEIFEINLQSAQKEIKIDDIVNIISKADDSLEGLSGEALSCNLYDEAQKFLKDEAQNIAPSKSMK
ncbi:MAG: hypothetical protein KAQ94_02735 [Arcobacteraceae bacterium]|nr:hypothetical protein [Arcobacteraceae bacterium]